MMKPKRLVSSLRVDSAHKHLTHSGFLASIRAIFGLGFALCIMVHLAVWNVPRVELGGYKSPKISGCYSRMTTMRALRQVGHFALAGFGKTVRISTSSLNAQKPILNFEACSQQP